MTAEQITLKGIQINHTVLGEASQRTPLLMLHGWGANLTLITPLAQALARQRWQCYALDMPGFGESEEPPEAWTVFDYADFVRAYMAEHKLEKVHLFGHSFGGRLALILGAEHANLLDKIVIADGAGIPLKSPVGSDFRLKTYKALRDGLNTVGLRGLSDNLRQWYNDRYGSEDFKAVSGVMRETFVKVVTQDLTDYVPKVKPSTLLLWGDKDEDTPLWQGQYMEKHMPDAGLVVYEGAGHYSYLERLPDATRVIDYFLSH